MKKLIRKLTLKKLPKEVFEHTTKHYLVVCRNDYELLSEYKLKELLLNPDRDIKFIFNWEDRLEINTVFEGDNND